MPKSIIMGQYCIWQMPFNREIFFTPVGEVENRAKSLKELPITCE